ncbi:hypothetical protein [Anianabacter salinae]|uniref:hypothetical protein n=1 Tax=Anianabacter salinae TaxID=2851023 RepID=UPI00225DFF8F|nr:hypothetical protein [Anianabacter salinae]MBV0912876.1 hypothetical protein [Anianabacter salinae]
MPHGTKIATCCYCGTRAALVLTGQTRHELACSACGAPLHDMKALRPVSQRPDDHELVRPSRVRGGKPKPEPRKSTGDKRKKKRKSPMKRFLSEAFDVIEDIFD